MLSWCFLQRPDMNGTLDGDTDLVPLPPPAVEMPFLWYKTTISCFTLGEQVAVLEDAGYTVRPLLMVRDVRAVWMSLMWVITAHRIMNIPPFTFTATI